VCVIESTINRPPSIASQRHLHPLASKLNASVRMLVSVCIFLLLSYTHTHIYPYTHIYTYPVPCYGLAENVLLASYAQTDVDTSPFSLKVDAEALSTENQVVAADVDGKTGLHDDAPSSSTAPARWLVASGQHLPSQLVQDQGGVCVVIVDPNTHDELKDGSVGEIWITGATVARGYWRKQSATKATFQATLDSVATQRTRESLLGGDEELAGIHFLRTGDLGVWTDNRLYITGRRKEVIIINGANFYPTDVESSIRGCHESIRVGSISACSVPDATDVYREKMTVLVELKDTNGSGAGAGSRLKKALALSEDTSFTTRIAMKAIGLTSMLPATLLNPMRLVLHVLRSRCKRVKKPPVNPLLAGSNYEQVTQSVRRAVLRHMGVPVHTVVLLRARSLLKTSSGKMRRQVCVCLCILHWNMCIYIYVHMCVLLCVYTQYRPTGTPTRKASSTTASCSPRSHAMPLPSRTSRPRRR
jgi:acyl-CoA synthetase (AMP-forming)/AMP-acid ligase II